MLKLFVKMLNQALLCGLFALFLASANVHASFEDGLIALQSRDAASAITALEAALPETETANLRHNLALAYFLNGNPSRALAEVERAIRLAPTDRELRTKAAALRQQLRITQPSNTQQIVEAIVWFPPPWFWSILATLAFWSALALILIPGLRDQRCHSIGAMACFLLAAISLAAAVFNTQSRQDAILVSSAEVHLRSAPASAAPQLETIPPGTRLHIIAQHQSFYQVRSMSGEGWLPESAVQRLSPH